MLLDYITFYDEIAQKALGRSPKHVLLLHENDLAAFFLIDLIQHIRDQNWTIISSLDPFSDPISQIEPDTLFNGQGRVAALAHALGMEKRDLVHETGDEVYLDAYLYDHQII